MTDTRKVIALAALLLPAAAAAQGAREFTFDFRPFAGMVAYAWRTAPGTYIGIGLGGGIDELDKTLSPDSESEAFHKFEQLAHASMFVRRKAGTHWDLDLGARLGIGDVRECLASDCWPGWFAGAYASAFFGGSRWKVGPRLVWARVNDSDQSDNVLYLEILTGRVRIGR